MSCVQKLNKGLRFEPEIWRQFCLAALELEQNRSRLLNDIVQDWLDKRETKGNKND